MALDPKQHGVFSWNELMTDDLEGAKAFYGGLFGWTFSESPIKEGPMAGQKYVCGHVGEDMAAGLMGKPPGEGNMPSYWGAYVTVDSLEASLEKVDALGGRTLLPPTEIPNAGRFAVIQDPQGAVLGIFQMSG